MRAAIFLLLFGAGCMEAMPSSIASDGPPPRIASDGAPLTDAPSGDAARFSALISTTSSDSCSQSWAVFASRSSFVLSLDEGGIARACRGRRYDQTGGGWEEGGQSTHQVREQQGYRGQWRDEGGEIDVVLTPNDGVCAPTRDERIPPDAWHLRCREVTGEESLSAIRERVLACEIANELYSDSIGYVVRGVFGNGAVLLLGTGPGLHVSVLEDNTAGQNDAGVELAPAPVAETSWQD